MSFGVVLCGKLRTLGVSLQGCAAFFQQARKRKTVEKEQVMRAKSNRNKKKEEMRGEWERILKKKKRQEGEVWNCLRGRSSDILYKFCHTHSWKRMNLWRKKINDLDIFHWNYSEQPLLRSEKAAFPILFFSWYENRFSSHVPPDCMEDVPAGK